MKVDWLLFNSMFPCYDSYKMSVWKEINEDDSGLTVEFVIPGYEKEDFNLYIKDGAVFLDIKQKEDKVSYQLLSKYRTEEFALEQAEARYKSGILKVTIPKDQTVKAMKTIKVS